jgi:hypothetical protein
LFVLGNKALALLLVAFGGVIVAGASFLLMSGYFFESAYDRDKRLLIAIDAIGPYKVPFDGKWWKQYKADRSNPRHRRGLLCETAALFVWVGGIVMLLLLLPMLA